MIRKIFYAFQFIIYYLLQLIRSNVSIAYITLSPKLNVKSGFVEVPLTLKSDFGLLLFSNLVSMTPGSLVADISKNKKTASVHVIFISGENEIISGIERMQKRIKQFTS